MESFHIVDLNNEREPQKGYYTTRTITFPMQDVIVETNWMVFSAGRPENKAEFAVYNMKDGQVIARKDQDRPKDRPLEDVISWNGNVWVLGSSYQKQNKILEIYCHGMDPSTLEETVPETIIGRLNLDSYVAGNTLGLRFATSPDASKLLIFYDRIRTEEDQQLVMCWVMDSNSGDIWAGRYAMDVESDLYATSEIMVDNDGAVHLASLVRIKKGRYGSSITHNYSIYRFHKEEKLERKLALLEGKGITGITLIQHNGKIIGAGFLAGNARKNETTDLFKVSFSPEADSEVDVSSLKLSAPIPAVLINVSCAVADDGSVYLTGGDRHYSSTRMVNKHIVSCAIEPDGSLRYATHIPRETVTYNHSAPEHITLTDGDAAILIIPDNDHNLNVYHGEGKLEVNSDSSTEVMQVTFDANGKPIYSRLPLNGLKVHYTSAIVRDDKRSVYFNIATKEISKKEKEYYKLFWWLK